MYIKKIEQIKKIKSIKKVKFDLKIGAQQIKKNENQLKITPLHGALNDVKRLTV